MGIQERLIKTQRTQSRLPPRSGDFLPDLCNVQAVLALVLVGELLALALTLSDTGLHGFSWFVFGKVSFLVLWIVLVSAASLCPLRPWLARQNSVVAGSVSYGLVLLVTLLFVLLGQYIMFGGELADMDGVLTSMIVSAVFSGVALRYFYLQQQLRNQQQAEIMARFDALQSRIRPHFLFNSMNTIASLISVDPDTAERMVVNLSHLFRATLRESRLVPLKDEVQLCNDYVAMEQLRLGQRLEMDWQCTGLEKSETIPSLLLQPLIENAIYHGIQPLPEGGTISVRIDVGEREVVVVVRNPVQQQNSAPPLGAEQAERSGNGLALANIRHRLAALYGKDGSYKVDKTGAEFVVTLRYPANYQHTEKSD